MTPARPPVHPGELSGGPVVIPDQMAAEVLSTLVLGLAQRVRRDGAQLGPGTRQLLAQLQDAIDRHARGCATANDPRLPPAQAETMTTAEAAAAIGCTQANVRHLAAAGRIRGRRTCRVWLLDPHSVITYARRNR